MKAKDIKHTRAYQQLKRAVELSVPDAANRPVEFARLVKRFIARCEEQPQFLIEDEGRRLRDVTTVTDAFTWDETAEGHDWWWTIHLGHRVENINPCPIKGKKKAAVKIAKPAPKKKVGWWQ